MLLAAFIKETASRLESLYPARETDSIVDILCDDLLNVRRYMSVIEPLYEIPADKLPRLLDAAARLESGEPVQYVTGQAWFHGRRFNVCPSVLIPRPETEQLCLDAIEAAAGMTKDRPLRILDLCTGSGCIAWTMALSVPGAQVTGTDISDDALSVAASQSFDDIPKGFVRPEFIKSDVLDPLAENLPGGPFDIILSNPPYIKDSEKVLMRTNVLEHEPHLALFVPDSDPLVFYRAIARLSARLLAPGGVGFSEINETLAAETEAVFASEGFHNASAYRDFYQKFRYIRY